MAWTVDSPAGMFMSASDGTRSYDLRQTCGVIKCEKGDLCQKMGRSNQVSPDVRGIELLHNFKLDGSTQTPHRIQERDSGRTRNAQANTVDGNLKTELESSGSMDRRAISSVWRTIFGKGVSDGMRLFDRLNAKARTINKDATSPAENAAAMGGTVDAMRFQRAGNGVTGMVIGSNPSSAPYSDSGEFIGNTAPGANPVRDRASITTQSDMNFGDRFAQRRDQNRNAGIEQLQGFRDSELPPGPGSS